MSKLSQTSLSYLKRFFDRSPQKFRKITCIALKKSKISHKSFYKELRFKGKFKVRIPEYGSFYMMNYGNQIEIETFWNGLFKTWESDTGWIWIELCKFCEVIFDVGANTGIYSLVAQTVNPQAEIHAFEPSRQIYKRLVINAALNNDKIKCNQIAISNKSNPCVFYDLPYPNDNGSLSPEKMKNWRGYSGKIVEYKVLAETLSHYTENNNIPKIDLLKIDIEMHEAEAIEGLGHYINSYKPIIILEILSEEVAKKLKNLINLDEFRLFHLTNNHTAEKLDDFKLYDGSLQSWEWNYLIFHKDLEDTIARNTSLFS